MKKYCLALDLVDDPDCIAEYERWHRADNGWPEIKDSIIESGVNQMEIYRTGNRLLMIMITDDDFDMNEKARKDSHNPKVQEWEKLMNKFQKPLPWAKSGEKWVLMNRIFNLEADEGY